jgi:hypothetical protein
VAEGSQFNEEMFKGSFIKMSPKRAEVRLDTSVPVFANLELLLTIEGKRIDGSLHCKVENAVADTTKRFLVHFTSMSPAVETFIRNLIGQAIEGKGDRARRLAVPSGERSQSH